MDRLQHPPFYKQALALCAAMMALVCACLAFFPASAYADSGEYFGYVVAENPSEPQTAYLYQSAADVPQGMTSFNVLYKNSLPEDDDDIVSSIYPIPQVAGDTQRLEAYEKVVVNSPIKSLALLFPNATEFDLTLLETQQTPLTYLGFSGCTNLKSMDLSRLNLSKIQSMRDMFSDCSSLKSMEFRNLDLSNVASMRDLFVMCSSLESVEFINCKTPKLQDMCHVFWHCFELTNINLEGLNTARVTNFSGLIWRCVKLPKVDLSCLDTSSATDMSCMISECVELRDINVSGFDTSNVTNMHAMFYGSDPKSLDLSSFDTSKVQNMSEMFYACVSLKTLDLSSFNTQNVESFYKMFYHCEGLETLDVSHFDISNTDYLDQMFEGCSSLTSLNVSKFNTSHITSMAAMFRNCSSLKNLNVSNFNTSKVDRMARMFEGCSSLTSLDLSSFTVKPGQLTPVPSLTGSTAGDILRGCDALSSLKLGTGVSDLTNFAIPEGTWTGPSNQKLTAAQLMSTWNPATMAGSWTRGDTAKKITVTWMNGYAAANKAIKSIELDEGSAITASMYPSVPTAPKGKIFDRWSDAVTDKDGNITITAIWKDEDKKPADEVFPDVKKGEWYDKAVNFVYEKGLITGYDNGYFGPNDTMNRAQLAMILWRYAEPEAAAAYESNRVAANTTGLPDVAANDWYTAAANWAVKQGIITGVDTPQGKRFEAYRTVSRETLCVMFMRYMGANENWPLASMYAMPDASKVSSWATHGVAWALDAKLIGGVHIGNRYYIDPTSGLTRAQASQVLMNAFDNGLLK